MRHPRDLTVLTHPFPPRRFSDLDLHRPLDLDFVLDAGAAAERARPCRIDPQLLTQDPDRVELLVALGVRNHEAAERVEPALLRKPVTADRKSTRLNSSH